MNRNLFLLLFMIVFLSGCRNYSIEKPEGFAVMKKGAETLFFSPDGIKMKIRVFPNKPEQDTEFWKNALGNHLEKKGYRPYRVSEGSDQDNTDYWIVVFGKEYFIYMTSVYSNSRYIVAVEAAGEKSLFEKYSSVIHDSVSSLKIR